MTFLVSHCLGSSFLESQNPFAPSSLRPSFLTFFIFSFHAAGQAKITNGQIAVSIDEEVGGLGREGGREGKREGVK